MKVWITKYALTTGIFTADGKISTTHPKLVTFYHNDSYNNYAHGEEWHTDPVSALAQAEKMRTNKINSWQSKIDALKNKIFEV